MTWVGQLVIVAVLVLLAALTGIKPKGTRKIANTRMMTAARLVLLFLAAIVALYMARGWFA